MNPNEPSWIAGLLDSARDGDTFTTPEPDGGAGPRLYGGLIAAQALAAAGRTVAPEKLPQSLHLYFVRGGQYGTDVTFHVERTRDGRAFDTRRVTATQHGKTILEMIASFHAPEPGALWQRPEPIGIELDAAVPKAPNLGFAHRFEIRVVPGDDAVFATPPFWIRTRDRIEDDPLVRSAMLTFMSDFGMVPVARPDGSSASEEFAASLDHAVWFHHPSQFNAWHLYHQTSPSASGSRGFNLGQIYNADGVLVASTAQEGLMRYRPPAEA